MTDSILDKLKAVSAFPIPSKTLVSIINNRGLDKDAEATLDILSSEKYNLALADVYTWLSLAPDVSQGGQSFSFTDVQRLHFRNKADMLYREFSDKKKTEVKPIYGYKGSLL